MLGNRPTINIGFGDTNIVGQELGEAYVSSLVTSDGVRGRLDLVMISGNILGRRIKQ